jgi:O-antigen/teichoic acid export membrane protein
MLNNEAFMKSEECNLSKLFIMPEVVKTKILSMVVDRAILLTILTRLIQAAGGIISIVFIARYLSVGEQGYYYTFVSILAIQLFFELGLSGIITQYAAYEFAHLEWVNVDLKGPETYQSRLSSLLRFCIKWFGILSVIFFFLLTAAGFYFFLNYNKGSGIQWEGPWVLLCFATALNLFIDPVLAFMDGIGELRDMSKVRLIQKSVNIILLFILFLTGFKLYSAGLASLISILVNYVQILFTHRKDKLLAIWKQKGEWKINYLKEIFPYQWRIAVSWMCGYFIFQLFNPVLFATEGPKVAGQMGMTLQAFNGISSLTMSWIVTKVPLFSQYIAKKEFKQLDALFNNTIWIVVIVNLLLIAVFDSGVWLLNFFHLSLFHRFLPVWPTIILSVSCFFNQIIFSWSTYLRCHKREPFLFQQIASAILVTLSTMILGNKFGLMGIVWGYSIIVIVVSFSWSYLLFITKKAAWH